MVKNSEVLGGIIADTRDRTLFGNISAGSVKIQGAEWGSIEGDISDQTDLIGELDKKEDNDLSKIATFFEENPEYQNRYLVSIADQPILDVKDYIQLVVDGHVGNDSMWIPFDVGKMCLIIDTSSSDLAKTIRFYVPQTGKFGVVDLTDELDIVRINYRAIDEIPPTEWADIQGHVYDNPDLKAILDTKVNIWDYITVEEVRSLFDN